MHLKKIIISGFKSFADRVVVSLDTGITGIVGPNGSGKSNIIDAVRWVMGEQNARNLRGEKATDIIFSGSERRKPQSMAEVSLVFDNSDFDPVCPPEYRQETEIALSRRLYADGQREYLINKKPCRLKDIVEFFAMTGLGGRSYSMIQQGQVDRILNAKAEDIREILEEAAGTTVYKRRKQEALKKLEATQLNLSRVEDILSELERQKNSLQEQVERARKYKERSAKLKEDEMALLAHNYTDFKAKVVELEALIANESDREVENIAAIAHYEARHAQLQGELDLIDPELQKLQETISVLREQIASREGMLKNAMQRQESGAKRLKELGEELGEDDANLKVLERQVDAANEELSAAETIRGELTQKIEGIQDEVDRCNESRIVFQNKIEDLSGENRNLERLVESNRLQQESLVRDIAKNEGVIRSEQERVVVLAEESAAIELDLRGYEAQLAAQQSGLDEEIREKHRREELVASLYGEQKNAQESRDALRERYHEAKARLTSLEEIESGATDVAATISELRKNEPELSCHRGLLAEHIRFKGTLGELSPKARGSFERWTEQLLVPSLADLNQLTSAAARYELSSMPVIVLDQIPSSSGEIDDWAQLNDAIPFTEFVELADQNAAGLEKVLARTFYLTTLSLDEQTTRCPRGCIVFTSQGVRFSGSEEYTVGAKAAAGLVSRRAEKEELARALKTVEGDLASQQSRIDQVNHQIHENRAYVADIDGKLQSQNREVLELTSNVKSLQEQFKHKNSLLESAQKLLHELETTQKKLADDQATLKLSYASLIEELDNTKREYESAQEEYQELQERQEEVMRQHNSLQVDVAKSEARTSALKDSFRSTKAQLELLQNKLTRRYDERARLELDIEDAKNELKMARDGIETMVLDREKSEEELREKRQANAGLVDEIRAIEKKLKECHDSQSKNQKLMSDRNLELERARIALRGSMEQALERYQIELDTYQFEYDDNFDPNRVSKAVANLRAKIESMGPINMMAIDEYDELLRREDFIRQQQDEVMASMALLETAIGEIEESSEAKFLEIFTTINREFGELFPILFPGGEGVLELTNPENPLEGGVEIICRLPGKKRKSMNLFSGGEKALTAISLIFALLKTKPTPFCFLDEVDAPLDEANVGRYNNILLALAEKFQFILITHNRRTMEVLDTLYGITMQEPGVSKVVGVDMQKDLPSHLRKAFQDKKPPAPARAVEGASAL